MPDADIKPVVETTVTERKEGDAAIQQPPPPAVIADDSIRKWVAQETILLNFVVIAGTMYLLFFKSALVSKDALPFVTGLLGTIIGSNRADVTTCINYLFGSSSGSTSKSQILDNIKK
jgi:hypothetical protein